ncbi:MAG: EAL domain-containing protein [Burkholderiaceae bacterium]
MSRRRPASSRASRHRAARRHWTKVGTGLRSFHGIAQIAVDRIKVDGSYVQHSADNQLDRAFVDSVERIAKVLRVQTIAAFVDDDATREAMRSAGVRFVQGYGVHEPEPFDAALGRPREQALPGAADAAIDAPDAVLGNRSAV